MKRGFLYLEALAGVGIFVAVLVCLVSCYFTVLHMMLRHEAKEKAALLAETAVISLQQTGVFDGQSEPDFQITLQTRETLWQGKLQTKELKVYYKKEREPLYNLFIYE